MLVETKKYRPISTLSDSQRVWKLTGIVAELGPAQAAYDFATFRLLGLEEAKVKPRLPLQAVVLWSPSRSLYCC